MQPLLKGNKLTVKSLINKLAYFAVFAYIVSAISCEMVENTAFISTIAIYLVFAVGVLFVIMSDRIIINEYVVLFAAFCAYVFIMTSSPEISGNKGTEVAYWLFTCVVLCILVFWMSSHFDNFVPIAMAAYIIGALILVLRVIDAYDGIVGIIELAVKEGETRVGNLIGNENALGLFFSTGILCSLVFFIKSKRVIVKILMIAAILVLGCMMLLTGSRKSLAFAIIGIILIVCFGYRKAKLGKRFTAIIVLVMALVAIYVLITTLPIFSTINERFSLLFESFLGSDTSYDTDNNRKIMIERGLEAFYQKPLFGHGAGYSRVLFGTYSHNNFVELLMNYGFVGFCLYYSFYIVLAIKLLKQALKSDLYAVFFFTYVCIQLVLGVGWVNYYSRPCQVITALAFGYLLSIEIKKKKGIGKDEIKESV